MLPTYLSCTRFIIRVSLSSTTKVTIFFWFLEEMTSFLGTLVHQCTCPPDFPGSAVDRLASIHSSSASQFLAIIPSRRKPPVFPGPMPVFHLPPSTLLMPPPPR